MAELSLAQRVQRLEGRNAVENLMARYCWALSRGQWADIVDCFALKTPDVRIDVGWGIYEGAEAIKKLFLDEHRMSMGDWSPSGLRPGRAGVGVDASAVIEVAEDGETAKGVWEHLGTSATKVSFRDGFFTEPGEEKGLAKAGWGGFRRAADFIKEDGEWKIWHYTVHGVFSTTWDQDWSQIENPEEPFEHSWLPDELKPNKPSIHPLWLYTPDKRAQTIPAPPKPYKTFDEKDAY